MGCEREVVCLYLVTGGCGAFVNSVWEIGATDHEGVIVRETEGDSNAVAWAGAVLDISSDACNVGGGGCVRVVLWKAFCAQVEGFCCGVAKENCCLCVFVEGVSQCGENATVEEHVGCVLEADHVCRGGLDEGYEEFEVGGVVKAFVRVPLDACKGGGVGVVRGVGSTSEGAGGRGRLRR